MSERHKGGTKEQFAIYWRHYGGFPALYHSAYFRGSIIVSAILFPLWRKNGWWDDVITATPSFLAFSLAAYTMVLALGNDRLLKILSAPRKDVDAGDVRNLYAELNASFVHFIVIQTIALGLAFLFKGWYLPLPAPIASVFGQMGISDEVITDVSQWLWFFGFLAFVYSIACGLAATMRLFTLSLWTAALLAAEPKDKK